MEDNITNHLEDGEKLLWVGKAAPFETADKTYKPVIIRKIIIAVILAVVNIVWDVLRSRTGGGFGLSLLMLIPIAIIPMVPTMDAMALRDLQYAATDRRLMILGSRLGDIRYDKIKEAVLKMDADGITSLLCGKNAVRSGMGSWRRLTVASGNDIINNSKECSKYVMYGIENPEEFEKAVKPYLTLG